VAFSVFFFDLHSVDVVVGAERNYLLVRSNIMHYTASNTVDVKVVGVHERHATKQEDSSADFAQRLVRGRKVHSHD
jgi:hypothetical protein